jgi:uncharacterized repeat protein (TIGR03833 family)
LAFVFLLNLSGIFCSFVGYKQLIMDGRKRSDVKPGMLVNIVQKHHQRTGELTEGFVKHLLTNAPNHPHGIKVRLETGEVGRVKEILEED